MNESLIFRLGKGLAAFGVAFALSVPAAVKVLVFLACVDLASCFLTHRGSYRRTVERIAVTLVLCGSVHVVYWMAHELSGFNIGFDIGTAVSMFYVFGEIIEILLNCSTVIAISPVLIEWLEKAQGMTNQQRRDLDSIKERASGAGAGAGSASKGSKDGDKKAGFENN